VSEPQSEHRGNFAHAYGSTPDVVYAWRSHLLRLLGDLKRKPVFDLPAPLGGVRDEPRPCSTCRQPTRFTTARGRSVHPTCEGFTDLLTDDAYNDVVWAIAEVIPIKAIEEFPCLFDPVSTLGVRDMTGNPRLPETGSVHPVE
jgi:hypothetical protein